MTIATGGEYRPTPEFQASIKRSINYALLSDSLDKVIMENINLMKIARVKAGTEGNSEVAQRCTLTIANLTAQVV